MPNHSHILLQTGEIHLSKIMKEINSRFASFRKKYNQKNGPVFQGRFKSILIGGDEYLKLVTRYIHRNPLKANISNSLGQYKWSSYPLLLRKSQPDWYNDSILLNLFDKDRKQAIKLYQKYVIKSRKEDERDYPVHCWGQFVAGSKDLYETVLKNLKNDKRNSQYYSIRKQYSGTKTLKNILKSKEISKGTLQQSLNKDVIRIRRITVYLLKYYCHWETSKISEELKTKKLTLSRDIRTVEHDLKIKKQNLSNIEKYLIESNS